MTEPRMVPISEIDPESDVNVRRTGVDANVTRVKESIQRHGYWPESAVALRDHPNADSEYRYQHVTGQCRIIAARELGLTEIPASVVKLTNDEAIQRSWNENEQRANLSAKDQAHWTETVYVKFKADGHRPKLAWKKTAEYLGITEQTARKYHRLIGLPDDIQLKVDNDSFPVNLAEAIAANSTLIDDSDDANDARMRERVDWAMNLERADRKHAIAALNDMPANATIDDLNKKKDDISGKGKMILPEWEIPTALQDALAKYGEERGITDPQTIVSVILHDTLTAKKRA